MFEEYSSLLLRFGLGSTFLYFGIYEKILKPELTRAVFENLNVTIPIPLGLFITMFGILEVIIGSALILGFYTRIAAILAALMIGTIVLQLGFLAVPRDPALFAIALSLILTGSSIFSLDRYFAKRKYL